MGRYYLYMRNEDGTQYFVSPHSVGDNPADATLFASREAAEQKAKELDQKGIFGVPRLDRGSFRIGERG